MARMAHWLRIWAFAAATKFHPIFQRSSAWTVPGRHNGHINLPTRDPIKQLVAHFPRFYPLILGQSTAICLNGAWNPPWFVGCSNTGFGVVQSTGGQRSCLVGIGTPLNGQIAYSNGAIVGPFPQGTVASVICNAGWANDYIALYLIY